MTETALSILVAGLPDRACVDALAASGASVAEVDPDAAPAALVESAPVDALVVGPEVPHPVTLAQRAYRADPDTAVAVLVLPEEFERVQRAIQFAPFLGREVICRPLHETELVAADVVEAAARAAERRAYRLALEAASAQLATASLRASPQVARYAGQLLDDAPLGVVTVDAKGRIFGWNRRANELFGCREVDALGRGLESFFPARSREALDELLRQPMTASGPPRSATLERDTPIGTQFLEATASALAESSVMLMISDETERVVAEREREEARAGLAFLVEAGVSLARTVRTDATLAEMARLAVPSFADWVIVDLAEGREFRRVAVAAREQPLEEALHDLQRRFPLTIDSQQPAAEAVRRAKPVLLRELDDQAIESRTQDDAHRRLIASLGAHSVIAVPLQARGEALGALTFGRGPSATAYGERELEVAERVAERAAVALDNARLLEETQRRARAARVLEAVADGVALVSPDGFVRLWNPAAAAATGIDAADVVDRRIVEVIPDWPAIEMAVPIAAAGEPSRTATLPVDLGGRERWLAIAGVAADEGHVYAFRDVSEEVAIERLRSEIVATVSHELRTPLTSVYGAAVTLGRPEVAADGARRAELLSIVVREAERLGRIVDDILLASRLEGGLEVERAGVDARAVVLEGVAAAQAKTHAARVRVHVPDELPPVIGDRDRLAQVLGNLVDNALKYSPGDAPVDVEVEPVGRAIRISVRDRGIGVPVHEQERIFEKFYRLDPSLTRGVGGTGLGLYISRELIRRMGGRIGLESHEGEGSRFFIDLAVAK